MPSRTLLFGSKRLASSRCVIFYQAELLPTIRIGQIKEQDDWEKTLKPGNKYYFTRNQSALLAFTIPQKWKQGAGVSIVATHVDSPNLRVSEEF